MQVDFWHTASTEAMTDDYAPPGVANDSQAPARIRKRRPATYAM
jgi:hypothetical protein